jgi:hypothetical protein
MELMVHMLLKKMEGWGNTYTSSLKILVEELKTSKKGNNGVVEAEDKFQEYLDDEK